MMVRLIIPILVCFMFTAASCASKKKKRAEAKAAIERMDREHEKVALKQQESPKGLGADTDSGMLADGIAARVNEEVIFISDLDESVALMLASMGVENANAADEIQKQKIREAALERLIEKKLLQQEAEKRGITVSEKEVERAFERYLRQQRVSKEQFYLQLASTKMPVTRFMNKFREELMVYKLTELEVRERVHVSEDQIESYYRAHSKDYAKPGGVRIQQIVLITRGDIPTEKKKKRRQIDEISVRLESGDDFGELARTFSQGPNADKGGDCGYFKAGELLEELDRAAFSLPIGEVSPVIQTSIGYHLIKVTERGEGEAKSIDSVRDEIRQILSRELFQAELKKWVDSLKETAYISRKL